MCLKNILKINFYWTEIKYFYRNSNLGKTLFIRHIYIYIYIYIYYIIHIYNTYNTYIYLFFFNSINDRSFANFLKVKWTLFYFIHTSPHIRIWILKKGKKLITNLKNFKNEHVTYFFYWLRATKSGNRNENSVKNDSRRDFKDHWLVTLMYKSDNE